MQLRKVERSRDGKIGGVCAGLADAYECDTIMTRIFFVALTLATAGLGGIGYLALWRKLPQAPAPDSLLDVDAEQVLSDTYGRVRYVSSLAPELMRDKHSRYVISASAKAEQYVSVAHMPPPEPPCVREEKKSEESSTLL